MCQELAILPTGRGLSPYSQRHTQALEEQRFCLLRYRPFGRKHRMTL
jgi:hypothetical protein